MFCQNCGKQIPDGSTFCTECGSAQNAAQASQFNQAPIAQSKKKKPGCLIAVGVVAAIILLVAIIPKGDSEPEIKPASASANVESPEPSETPVSVSASDLYKQYDENEVSADKLYKDKLLQLSGVIDSVTVTLGQIQVIVTDGQEWSWVMVYCNFEDAQSDTVSTLKKGDNVVIQGRCRGKALTPALDDCAIVS